MRRALGLGPVRRRVIFGLSRFADDGGDGGDYGGDYGGDGGDYGSVDVGPTFAPGDATDPFSENYDVTAGTPGDPTDIFSSNYDPLAFTQSSGIPDPSLPYGGDSPGASSGENTPGSTENKPLNLAPPNSGLLSKILGNMKVSAGVGSGSSGGGGSGSQQKQQQQPTPAGSVVTVNNQTPQSSTPSWLLPLGIAALAFALLAKRR